MGPESSGGVFECERNMYIVCPDGTEFLRVDKWVNVDFVSNRPSFLVEEINTERSGSGIPLCYFLVYAPQPIYVGGEGTDVEACGWECELCIWSEFSSRDSVSQSITHSHR